MPTHGFTVMVEFGRIRPLRETCAFNLHYARNTYAPA